MSFRKKVASRWNRMARPRLEALEGRWCPSTVSFNNGVLTIRGDANDNEVSIVADGDDFVVTVDGEEDTFTGVERIRADLRGGDDEFTLDLNAANSPLDLRVDAQGGAGADTFTVVAADFAGD